MKNRLLPLIFAALFATTSLIAQVCGTYEGSLEEQIQKYPAFYQGLESLNADLEANHKSALSKMTHLKIESGKKIIPVVVHVIHNGGGENLSVSEIQNGLDHLNTNINGQADNFLAGTPDIFASVRGDLNVEFRLAKKDPLGNPTSGIIRVRSELTKLTATPVLPRDRVKALSYWNSYQYLNIWVVKEMPAGEDGSDEPALNGYAQFPEPNPNRGDWMSTDGVVICENRLKDGKTITHEVGHWLGLCHTWACGAGTCGTDNVADTPQDSAGIFDFNGTFPFNVDACTSPTGPAGEMYMNYMDYQNDNVQTMFTKGQNVVMNETLDGVYDEAAGSSAIGYREYMWSADNIAATGVSDGYLTPACAQKPDFAITTGISSMCKGESFAIKGNKTLFGNGNVTAMLWDFGDGQTDNTNSNQLLYTYATEGLFNVSLTVEYNETTEARASSLSDLDIENASSHESISTTIIVQGTESELTAMGATNIALHLDIDSLSFHSFWKYNAPEDSIVGAHSSFFLGLDTFQVIFTANYGDSLEIEDYERLAGCYLGTWQKDSLDWQGNTVTFYYGSYESNAFDAYFMDTLFYRGELEQTTYIAYYDNTCTSTTVKENFIAVNPTSSSNTAGSYTYSFEDVADLSDDWHITTNSTDGDWSFNLTQNSAWEWVDGIAVSGNACIRINRDNLTIGSDELISEAYDLSALSNPAIKFSWSGAAANAFPVNELKISYSTNCGEDWQELGSLTNYQVANAGLYATSFKPEVNNWNDTIMTKAQLKNDNIKFKFDYVTSGSANNFYIDNVKIGEALALFAPSVNASKLSIYPNPTNGQAVIRLEYLADMNVEVKLVNILGAEVRNLFDGEIVSNYYVLDKVDLSTLETGIYFVKVVANGNVVTTDKLILSK